MPEVPRDLVARPANGRSDLGKLPVSPVTPKPAREQDSVLQMIRIPEARYPGNLSMGIYRSLSPAISLVMLHIDLKEATGCRMSSTDQMFMNIYRQV